MIADLSFLLAGVMAAWAEAAAVTIALYSKADPEIDPLLWNP